VPIHDWTRVIPGGFHTFHQDWTVEINRTLNRGLLPPGYTAFTDLRVMGWEPDVVTIQSGAHLSPGGQLVLDVPPRAKQITKAETEAAVYARKANRIAVRHDYGNVVAIIEVMSPGNKDSSHAIRSFTTKAIEFLQNGVNLLIIDLFPPTPRDPDGIHHLIWAEVTDKPTEPRPADMPLTVVSYDTSNELTAYINPVAVGDSLPDTPLFLAPGSYINLPLEVTYDASWAQTPKLLRDLVESPTA
jgi:hypothetical protein